GAQISSGRPAGVEGGLDLGLHFDHSALSITGELAGVHFFSPDADQLNMTGGVTLAASEQLDFSLLGLVGFLGGDRADVLFGASPPRARFRQQHSEQTVVSR